MRAQAQAEAQAAAQAQVEEQVKKTLEAEKAAYVENLTDSIMKERMKTEDERLMVQLYVRTRTTCSVHVSGSLCDFENLSSYCASFSFLPSCVVSADGAEGKTGENLYVHDSLFHFQSALIAPAAMFPCCLYFFNDTK